MYRVLFMLYGVLLAWGTVTDDGEKVIGALSQSSASVLSSCIWKRTGMPY